MASENLKPLSSLPRDIYKKVFTRMCRKQMTKHIIDEQIYYDVNELENYKPKRSGRKARG